tara:strand:+ start:4443 stop:4679 length:237 start_codon:yes stop_codon:yes gene_type:complete
MTGRDFSFRGVQSIKLESVSHQLASEDEPTKMFIITITQKVDYPDVGWNKDEGGTVTTEFTCFEEDDFEVKLCSRDPS